MLDFYCPGALLRIEIDGGSHGFGDQPARDDRRDAYLQAQGIRTIRIAASEIISGAHEVALWLIDEAGALPHRPLHPSGPPPP